MSTAGYGWLSVLVLILYATLSLLHKKFPAASKPEVTAVLAIATIILLSVCSLFPMPHY
jgi:hypothetical protein